MEKTMEKTIRDMMVKVERFHHKILGGNPLMDARRWQFRRDFLLEEIQEADEAYSAEEMHEVVDGLVDLVYVALGTLLEMGVPPDFPFDAVHEANMKKERGMTKRGEGKDAIKPEGWLPPDHRPLMERVELLQKISPVFVELTKMRLKKGLNYNRGTVKREDHFPLGDHGYFSIVWIKSIRLRSLTESLPTIGHCSACNESVGNDDHMRCSNCTETRRLIDRELNDLINYACFWAEFMRGLPQ